MAWKPTAVAQKSSFTRYDGIALASSSKDANGVSDWKEVTFKFIENEKNVENKIDGAKFTFKFKDLPKEFQSMKFHSKTEIMVNIVQNEKEDTVQITGIRPVIGTVWLKFAGFARKHGSKEIMLIEKMQTGKFGSGNGIKVIGQYTIVDKSYTGGTIPHYLFVMSYGNRNLVEQDETVGLSITKKGYNVFAAAWNNLIEVHHLEKPIKWPQSDDIQDVLVNIESALLESGAIFTTVLHESYPTVLAVPDIQELETFYDNHPELKPVQKEEVEEEEEAPKKSPTIAEIYDDDEEDDEDARN